MTLADEIQALADFVRAHPSAIPAHTNLQLTIFARSARLADVARAGYGHLEKHVCDDWYMLRRYFGPSRRVLIEWNEKRDEICTKVKIGEKVHPAKPEETVVIPAKPERVEEIFEWRCPESLLSKDEQADADKAQDPSYVPPAEDLAQAVS
jgi:hypothetical protein